MGTVDWLLFVSLGLIWGSSFLWIKIAVGEIGPFAVVGWRLLFGIVGLAVVTVTRRAKLPTGWSLWRNLAILGAINTALPFVLITWGERSIDSAVASVLNSTVPLFTMVLAHFSLVDDRITIRKAAGLIVGFGGVLLLMSRDLSRSSFTGALWGQLAVLVAAFSYANGGVFARRMMRRVPALTQAFIPMIAADIMVWPFALGLRNQPLLPSTGRTWIALVWLGLLGSCTAYLLYFSLLHRIGPTRATMVTYLVAVVGVGLGVVFLNEQLDARLALGSLMVVAGVAIVNIQRESRASASTERGKTNRQL